MTDHSCFFCDLTARWRVERCSHYCGESEPCNGAEAMLMHVCDGHLVDAARHARTGPMPGVGFQFAYAEVSAIR